MAFSTIAFETSDDIAWVTLNRPHVLNAFNVQMRDDLTEVLTAIRDDDEIRALVLRGAGRAFCAGADLTEFGTAPSPTAARRIRFARDVWGLLGDLEVPSVAALHGFVFGSGLEMALFCDLRIAAAETEFAMPEVQRGLIPAAGGTQTLPRVGGLGVALDLMLTGRRIDAHEALRLGIVSEVVPGATLADRTQELARELASLPTSAARAVRRAVREGMDLSLEEGLRLEARLAASLRTNSQRRSEE
jgi:enoyl-CoA hydratase/carnithine racemase